MPMEGVMASGEGWVSDDSSLYGELIMHVSVLLGATDNCWQEMKSFKFT